MKYLLAFLLGFCGVSISACASTRAAQVKAETVHLQITGMT